MESTWHQISKEISEHVARAGRTVVAVDGRSGHTSSGILWQPNLVLTAAHTIRHDKDIRIVLEPGHSIRARLAGRATGADLALLRIDQEIGQAIAEFADTAALAVGELVVAI